MTLQAKPVQRKCRREQQARQMLVKYLTDKTMTGVGIEKVAGGFLVFGVKQIGVAP